MAKKLEKVDEEVKEYPKVLVAENGEKAEVRDDVQEAAFLKAGFKEE